MPWSTPGEGTDLLLADKLLKEYYREGFDDLLYVGTALLKMVRRTIVPFGGRRMVIELRMGGTGAIEALPLSGYKGASPGIQGAPSLVEPGYQTYEQALVTPKIIMGALGVPQDVQDLSRHDKMAYISALDAEYMGLRQDFANRLNDMVVFGGSPAAIVDDLQAGSGTANKDILVDNSYRLYKNSRVEFFDPPGGTPASPTFAAERAYGGGVGYRVVNSIDRNFNDGGIGHKISLDGTVTALELDDEIWFKGDVAAVNNANPDTAMSFLGLDEIISATYLRRKNKDGNLFYLGIDQSTNDLWRSQVYDAGAADITYDMIQTAIDDVHDGTHGEINLGVCNRTTRREIAKKGVFNSASSETTSSNFRYINSTKINHGFVFGSEDDHYAGGNDYLMFDNRIPIMVDRAAYGDFNVTAKRGNLYLMDTRYWFLAMVTDMRFWAPQGRVIREAPNSKFGLVAHPYIMGELVCRNRAAQAKITNIKIN